MKNHINTSKSNPELADLITKNYEVSSFLIMNQILTKNNFPAVFDKAIKLIISDFPNNIKLLEDKIVTSSHNSEYFIQTINSLLSHPAHRKQYAKILLNKNIVVQNDENVSKSLFNIIKYYTAEDYNPAKDSYNKELIKNKIPEIKDFILSNNQDNDLNSNIDLIGDHQIDDEG